MKIKDSYMSPDWILKMFEGWFDPCPYELNPEFNGLEIEWEDRTYVNPPYSNPLPWVEKSIVESKKGKLIVMLLKVDLSTRWFSRIMEADTKILWINGRLPYIKKEYSYQGNVPVPFPQMLVVFIPKEIKILEEK